MKTAAEHWNAVYETRAAEQMSWFQATADTSLALVREGHVGMAKAILDVGAGASRLVDGLLQEGYRDVTLLDISEAALEVTRRRLGERSSVQYLVADVTQWNPPRQFALWHDRAAFHFLVEERDRAGYRQGLSSALAPGSVAIIATFDLDGPERCSSLPVCRYSLTTLAQEFDGILRLVETRQELHQTPAGAKQPFVFAMFERIGTWDYAFPPDRQSGHHEAPQAPA